MTDKQTPLRALDQIKGIHPSKTQTMSRFVVHLSIFRALEDCQEACWKASLDAPAPRISGDVAIVDVALFEDYEVPDSYEEAWEQLRAIITAAQHDKIDVLVLFW